jgi:hypothetical protein
VPLERKSGMPRLVDICLDYQPPLGSMFERTHSCPGKDDDVLRFL